MRLELSPFEPEHLEGLEFREWEAQTLTGGPAEMRQRGLALMASGPAFTARVKGRVIVCGGLAIMWPGVAQAWAFLAPAALEHGFKIHRASLLVLAYLVKVYRLHRIQAPVRENHEKGHRWLSKLGFEPEGPAMKHYGPDGANYQQYVRLPCLS